MRLALLAIVPMMKSPRYTSFLNACEKFTEEKYKKTATESDPKKKTL